jgi:dTDP-4-dehydrorhamnose reductase
MKKLAIIGAGGQLGSDIIRFTKGWDVKPLTHQDIEVCDFAKTRSILSDIKPDVLINLSAYHRVDECEDNIEKSFQVNAFAVRNLAQLSNELNLVLVHISTDYVFDGKRNFPYTEEDTPNPLSVYGVSKLAGEHFVRSIAKRYYLIRSCGLYGVKGASGKGGNFVETMLRLANERKPLKVVSDQVCTPTYTVDLAEKIMELVNKQAGFGFYHLTSDGETNWFNFAKTIFDYTDTKPANFIPVTSAEFGAKAKRPPYSVLENRNLINAGFKDMPPWQDALKSYLKEKKHI